MILSTLILATVLTSSSEVPRLTAAELAPLLDKGDAIAVDVRGSVPFELGHIAGATWMPLGLIEQRSSELPDDKLLVTYCTCNAEESSLEGALLLSKLGFGRVAVLTGGYPAWKGEGFPIGSNRGGRLAPPAAVTCDRNQLTSYSGAIRSYRRGPDKTALVIETEEQTVEQVTIRHSGSDDPSKWFLVRGTPFTPMDWNRIEKRKGELIEGMRATAWVCEDGRIVVDWKP